MTSLTVYVCPNPRENYQSQILYYKDKLCSAHSISLKVFAEDTGVSRFCDANNIYSIPSESFCNAAGIPLMNMIFEHMFRNSLVSKGQYASTLYLNSDLIIDKKFLSMVQFFIDYKDCYFVSGRRLNVDSLNYSCLQISNFQHWGTDYFLFRSPESLCTKKYEIGRFFWDGHVLTRAYELFKEKKLVAIDASNYTTPIHINHVYWWGNKGDKTTTRPLVRPATSNNLKITSLSDSISIMSFPYEIESILDIQNIKALVIKKRNRIKHALALKYHILFKIHYIFYKLKLLLLKI